MRLLTLLLEDKKVGQIQPGEVYKNDKGQSIKNLSTHFFPEHGSFEDDSLDDVGDGVSQTAQEKLHQAISDAADQLGIPIKNIRSTNKPENNKAAGLSVWQSGNGVKIAFLRYAAKINKTQHGISSWNNSDFKRDYGYEDQDERTQSELTKVKPTDYFKTGSYTTGQILETVRRSDNFSPEINEIFYRVLVEVVNGTSNKVPGAAQYEKAIQKYLGEIAGPLALLNPSSLLSGNYKDAEKHMLSDGKTFADLKFVTFPEDHKEPLVDSYVSDKTDRIGISSKSKKKLTPASIKSIDKLLTLHADEFSPRFLSKYKTFIDVVKILSKETNQNGPFKIGLDSGYITQNEVDALSAFMKNGTEFKVTPNMKKLASYYPNPDKTKNTYHIGFHILAGLAAKIANTLNEKNPTPFFKEVLSKAGFIQIVSNTSKLKGGLAFSDFKIIYPAAKSTEILFDANSNYFATTKPKDKMAFKMQ